VEYDQAEYVGTLRTQSHANADLVDTLTDCIRSDAIDADGCEGESQKRENVQSEESHALRGGDAGNDFVHRPDIEDRLILSTDQMAFFMDRFKAGDTQTKIARDLGISPATVRNYLRLAGVLGTVCGRRKSAG